MKTNQKIRSEPCKRTREALLGRPPPLDVRGLKKVVININH